MNRNFQIYLQLGEYAKNYDHSQFLEEIEQYFGFLYKKDEMDYIGIHLQVVDKGQHGSKPMYLHGYVLSSALNKYINDNKENLTDLTILETGTARGFSAIVMAKMLEKYNLNGIIHTTDLIPHDTPQFENCLKAALLQRHISRVECIQEWSNISEKYIQFHSGDSTQILNNLNLNRIHFAFLDGAHYYENVKHELEYVCNRQLSGDVIVCDDYTLTQFPGICKAIDEFLGKDLYNYKVFYGNDGRKLRGYVYMIKK